MGTISVRVQNVCKFRHKHTPKTLSNVANTRFRCSIVSCFGRRIVYIIFVSISMQIDVDLCTN